MGWWPSRLAVLLNLVIGLGYGVVNCLTAGLTLTAVNGHGMSAAVGIIVSALLTWVIAVFGYKWFKQYEKYELTLST
jgi:purine-cytosine permease-like protein